MIKRSKPLKRTPLVRSTKRIERRAKPRPFRLRSHRPNEPSDSYLLSLLLKAVRLRDPICVSCRQNPTYDTMHLIGRSARRVRWDLDNVMGGCRKCHDKWTRRPKLWRAWWERKIGTQRTDAILNKATNMNVKPDPFAARDRLVAFIKEMQRAERSSAAATA